LWYYICVKGREKPRYLRGAQLYERRFEDFSKKIKKPLDKDFEMCYNIYRKQKGRIKMKYRIEITNIGDSSYNERVFLSDPIAEEELIFEILPVLLKPSMFGNTDYFRVSILPEGA
jgi:hypothetical protein